MQRLQQVQVRTFGYFGLLISALVLGVSLAGIWLLNVQGTVLTLAIATISMQIIINDLFWLAQKRLVESGGETLFSCQLSGQGLHELRQPLLTVRSLISDGMPALIWTTILSGALGLALRAGVHQSYIVLVWVCGGVLSVSLFGWVLFGRRCLRDDEVIISEGGCLAGGRLDRWNIPGWHLLSVEWEPRPNARGGQLVIRILREGPYRQMFERRITLPEDYAAAAIETCRQLQCFIRSSPENARPRFPSSRKDRTAKKREQHTLEKAAVTSRASHLGDAILLAYALILGVFSLLIPQHPLYTSHDGSYSFADWDLPAFAMIFALLAVMDILLNTRRNRAFRAGLGDQPLLLFRLPSLWLECYLPASLNAARRELVNCGLLMLIGTLFAGLAFSIRQPEYFRIFIEQELAVLLIVLLLVFLAYVVYRDWALRRRLGLVQLVPSGLWLFDKQYSWVTPGSKLLSCEVVTAPPHSPEFARLALTMIIDGQNTISLKVPLDLDTATKTRELLEQGQLFPS